MADVSTMCYPKMANPFLSADIMMFHINKNRKEQRIVEYILKYIPETKWDKRINRLVSVKQSAL